MKIGIIDISSFSNDNGLYHKATTCSMYSIMPQVIGVYAKQLGHDVWYYPYFGYEDLYKNLNLDVDIIFISSYTMNAYLAYAISNIYRKNNITTVIGGPHARSFPNDCKNYFDFVVGLCDFDLIKEIINHHELRFIEAKYLSSEEHPKELPLLKDRWEFIEIVYKKFPKIIRPTVSLLSSTGCNNTCEFCVDSRQKYNYLSEKNLIKDLMFLKHKDKKINVLWHDPNFGIRLNTTMDIIESVNAKHLYFMGEMNINKLNEENCKRLQQNQFIGMAPGIESWRSFNNKSTLDKSEVNPYKKVFSTSEHMRMVNKYIPVIQLNMIFGLDIDTEINMDEAFDLTELFIKNTPGVYVNFQTITIFGKSTPLGDTLYNRDRVIRTIPYNLLDGFSMTNVRLKTSSSSFYKRYAKLLRTEKSLSLLFKRINACKSNYGKIFYILKNLTGRLDDKHFDKLSNNIINDPIYTKLFNGYSNELPDAIKATVKNSLGNMYPYLPDNLKMLYN